MNRKQILNDINSFMNEASYIVQRVRNRESNEEVSRLLAIRSACKQHMQTLQAIEHSEVFNPEAREEQSTEQNKSQQKTGG